MPRLSTSLLTKDFFIRMRLPCSSNSQLSLVERIQTTIQHSYASAIKIHSLIASAIEDLSIAQCTDGAHRFALEYQ